jgi:N-sulfoglucosamine sulfohydrolase
MARRMLDRSPASPRFHQVDAMPTYSPIRRSLASGWLLVSTVLLICGGSQGAQAVDTHRPNVLFIFADDWGRYASVYAGLEPGGPGDAVSTPNIDRVARQGVLFTQAYVNAPSCTPCRSSLLSGQHFWRTGRGAILHGAVWDDSIPTFPLLMEESGYKLGHTYKVWSPGTPADAPFGGTRTAVNSAGRKFNSFSQHVDRAEDKERARQELLAEVRGNFTAFLDSVEDDQPFCYWFGPTNCHRKWIQGSGLKDWGIDPERLRGKLPEFLPDVEAIREDFADYLGEVQALDLGIGALLDELERRGLSDNTLVVISGDHGIPGIPRGKCDLYDLGTRVPLVVRWPGVSGQGLVVEDFVSLPDLAPTLLEVAGVRVPPEMTARSLLPVLKAKRGGIVDASRDHVILGRERHVSHARHDGLPYPHRAIRTSRYLYIRNFAPDRFPLGVAPGFGLPADTPYPTAVELREETYAAFADLDASPTKAWLLTHQGDPAVAAVVQLTLGLRPAEELYDVEADPDHMRNLAEDPAQGPVKKALSSRLFKVLHDTDDPRVTQDGAVFERPPFTDLQERR